MNVRRFKNSFLTFFFAAALFVAWLAEQSSSLYQQRMTLLISVLMLMLCIALALAISMPEQPKRPKAARSSLTPEQQRNAAMFRHQPASAQFKVRMFYNEQLQRTGSRVHRQA
jgi:preprotein translocase subunit SecG